MQAQHHRPRLAGVTLVELLTVVAILSVLMGVVWLAVAGRVKGAAKQTQIKSDMRQVVVAVNLYRNDNDGGLPSNWHSFGYYTKVPKGSYGGGYPPYDVYNDKPPRYDVSYHTPECAQPPWANMGFIMFRQMVEQFQSRPRANTLDVEHDPAVSFAPACLANTRGTRPVLIRRDGQNTTYQLGRVKSLSADLAGTVAYQWPNDWFDEILLGN